MNKKQEKWYFTFFFVSILLLMLSSTSCNQLEDSVNTDTGLKEMYGALPQSVFKDGKADLTQLAGTYFGDAWMIMDPSARPEKFYPGAFDVKIVDGTKLSLSASIKPGKMPIPVNYVLENPCTPVLQNGKLELAGEMQLSVSGARMNDYDFSLNDESYLCVNQDGELCLKLCYNLNGASGSESFVKFFTGVRACVITFDSQGGDALLPRQVKRKGETVREPPAGYVEKNGFVFSGWYTEKNGGGSKWDFTLPVEHDMTLYAHWTADTASQNKPFQKPQVNTFTGYKCVRFLWRPIKYAKEYELTYWRADEPATAAVTVPVKTYYQDAANKPPYQSMCEFIANSIEAGVNYKYTVTVKERIKNGITYTESVTEGSFTGRTKTNNNTEVLDEEKVEDLLQQYLNKQFKNGEAALILTSDTIPSSTASATSILKKEAGKLTLTIEAKTDNIIVDYHCADMTYRYVHDDEISGSFYLSGTITATPWMKTKSTIDKGKGAGWEPQTPYSFDLYEGSSLYGSGSSPVYDLKCCLYKYSTEHTVNPKEMITSFFYNN